MIGCDSFGDRNLFFVQNTFFLEFICDFDFLRYLCTRNGGLAQLASVPHALRGILFITVENGKAEGDRNYQPAYEEYVKAKDLLTSSDDTAYFQQLESLITQLQNGNWL
ncbi:MAG: hypothetical protein IIW89_07700 [Alistipes sp.]|nr:hypothetical protein [Alistipes sp.]